ncbi:sterol desaturase family protein [Elstera litoralis]|uniref:sterol desaturase family protein n=1 Tax=Elstera litoralis TaxID=552518 RepID=UPI000A03456C
MVYASVFVLWSLCAYGIHRLGHFNHPFNPMFRIHMKHHKVQYGRGNHRYHWPECAHFFLWFGDFKASADVWITLLLPAITLSIIFQETNYFMIIIVYLYEVFLSENLLDHNPEVDTIFDILFAVGVFHLRHHKSPAFNFGLYTNLWDHIFLTARYGSSRKLESSFERMSQNLSSVGLPA